MLRGIACVLAVTAGGVLTAVAPPREPALSAQSREGYKLAVESADAQEYNKALARIDGLLMRTPVSIGIDLETVPRDAVGFAEGVKQGLAIWSAAISDSPFRLAGANETPAMRVRFVDEVKGSADVQGMINARREFTWSKSEFSSKVTGTIQVVRRTEGRLLTKDEVSEVVAHELGHLLGLDDVEGTQGLMGAFVGGEPRIAALPAERDVVVSFRNTLKQASSMIQQRSAARRMEMNGTPPSTGRAGNDLQSACKCHRH